MINIFAGFPRWVHHQTSQLVFWLMWSIYFPIFSFLLFLAGKWSFLLSLLIPTVLAFAGTALVERSGSLAWIIYGSKRKNPMEAQRDFNISTYFNKGRAAQRDEKWLDAVKYYKGALTEDPEHIEARFNLARIYHQKLNRKGSALHEYEKLMQFLPELAPYHMTAREAVEELIGKRPAPEPIRPLEWKA